MRKLLDGMIFGVYIVISVFVIVLAIAGAILKPNADDSGIPNDQELVAIPSESLQSPHFDGKFKYLANNGDVFEREIAQSNANKGNAESNKSIPDDGTESSNILTGVRITYYCNCEKCCGVYAGGPTASGRMPEAGRTVAANPRFIPQGSIVVIGGQHYIVEDTGPHHGVIDIYVNGHEEAIKGGTQLIDVEVKRYGW